MSQSGSFSSGGIPKNPTFAVLTVTSRLDLNSGATFNLYNTADKTTNYERLRARAVTNIFQILSERGGSGTSRPLQIGVTSSDAVMAFGGATTSTSGLAASFTASAASGSQNIFSIGGTLNQSSTAGATILNVDPTVTATGSGTYLIQRWGWNAAERARMDSSGILYAQAIAAVASTGIGWSSSLGGSIDLRLVRDAANELALRLGTSAQTRRTYETYTDASNYSRIYEAANSGGFAYYGTQAAGTGARRPLIVQHFATTVAALPAAATAGAGSRCFVSDALGPVFGAAVVGGGAVNVPVYSDGANWLVG